MLDRWSLALIKGPLNAAAKPLARRHISANQVSVTGFAIGLAALPLLAFECYSWALLAIALNRLADGLDGELARLTAPSDSGAFLDIVLDFLFYAAVIAGFALARPDTNALPAALLLFGFMGTGSSFLAFAILAERRGLTSMRYPSKGFYYLSGITEGTETIGFFVLMCLLPDAFAWIAGLFFVLCVITTATRVIGGFHSLRA
ncbi:CDP-alcohol phosphatidyltransferase family protein [Saccharospirillum mangrovi]|uniref:CDP-alcohol phosphatidyltransferase family protein n=1 Tax=Saccharospirillum mangrovi TaxID=2161747 RepID=UPI000D380335|nr:CDP-alcohol phosphatidyltransferase family protein [Saccharospirillum mangrovi]